MIKKPMLASACADIELLHYPVLATPKLDGVRCLKIRGRAVSRSFKPILNHYVRNWIESNLPDGLDGELVSGSTFSETTSAINSRDTSPEFSFYVFDYVSVSLTQPYEARVSELCALPEWSKVKKVIPVLIKDLTALLTYEQKCLDEGYEGVMVRTPHSPYKCGRSTELEGWLLKIKRFADAEAEVIAVYEGKSNQNKAEIDELGHTKRSERKRGLIGRGELGGFLVQDLKTGSIFHLGYNHLQGGADAASMWAVKDMLVGRIVKYRHQPFGAKIAPRFPQFLGFREPWDMDEMSK